MQCTDVLARWSSAGTALSCVAEVQPDGAAGRVRGPALRRTGSQPVYAESAAIRMPSCRLELSDEPTLRSESGSVVILSDWEEILVETDWRGTKVELTYGHGAVVIADYDCAGEMKEVIGH